VSPKKGREHIEPYVLLENKMTDSAAWTSLSFGAVWVYIELRKSFDYNKGGNNHLILPYSQVSWKMNSRTFKSKKQELLDKGFIKVVDQGGLFNRPAVYALSNNWERISREIVGKEGREARKLLKKSHPQELPLPLKAYMEVKKHKKKMVARNILICL